MAIFKPAAVIIGVTKALLNAGLGFFILPKLPREAQEEFREDSPLHPLCPGRARPHERSPFCSGSDNGGGRVLARRDRGARRQLVLAPSFIGAWFMAHIWGAGEVSPLR